MEFSPEQWTELRQHADERGLIFLSSPFSSEALDLLCRVGVGVWKVASGEIANLPLLERMVATGLPMLFSSGMSSMAELDCAVGLARDAKVPFAVMQCTSIYPCPAEKVGLNLLPVFRERYGGAVGLSDHSGTIYPGLAAAVMGAEVVEVHVTFSREMFGPDVPASLTTTELAQLVEGVRFTERMRASAIDKDGMAAELQPMRKLFTQSVVARVDLPAGTVLAAEHLTTKKPGNGIPAGRLSALVGSRLTRSIRADEFLVETDLEMTRG
jgi:N-acetylneuraminate synthase